MNTKNIELEKNISTNQTANIAINSENINTKIPNTQKEFHPVENYHPTKNKSISIKITSLFGILIFVFIILLCIAFLIFTFVNSQHETIHSGIYIKGIDVSNLSIDEAKEKVQNYINENLPENINLVHNDFETSIPLSALEVNFDVDSAVEQAYETGRTGNLFKNSWTALKTMISKVNIEPTLTLNEEQLNIALNDISSKLPDAVIESGYYIDGNNLVITSGSEGNVVDVNQMRTYIKNGILNLTLKNRTLEIATVSEQPSEINIDKIYSEIYKEPVDAYYTQEPYAVYPSENGLDFAYIRM